MIRDCRSDNGQRYLLIREYNEYNVCYQIPTAEYGDLKVKTQYDNNSTDDITSVYTLLSYIRHDGVYQFFTHYRFICGDVYRSRYEGISDYRLDSDDQAFLALWEIGEEVYSG